MALSLPKRLAFTLVAVAGGLALVEGTCFVVERIWRTPERAMPLPSPGCPEPCLEGQVAELPRSKPLSIELERTSRGKREGWGFRPGSTIMQGHVATEINELGFRGPVLGEKGPDELRLLALGDSSVFGYGLEEGMSFHELAAADLSATLGRPVNSINGAIPGHSAEQSLEVLRDLGPRQEPDVVLLCNLWSDLYHEATVQGWERPRWSATWRVATRLLGPWLKPRTVGWLDPELDAGTPGLGRSPRSSLREYRAHLAALATETAALGAEAVIVRLPAPIDLDPAGVPEWIADYRFVQDLVAREHGLLLVDGPSVMAARDHALTDYYDQVHPSAAGHAKLGEGLAQALSEHLRAEGH